MSTAKFSSGDIVGEVLIGQDDFFFLNNGGQYQMDYLVGKKVPDPKSVENFVNNIKSRAAYCKEKNIAYAHIVFPSKPVICRAKTPESFQGKIKSLYLTHYNKPELQNPEFNLFYPKDLLDQQNSIAPIFVRQDTHMTDFGSLSVIQMIFDSFNIDLPLKNYFNEQKRVWQGDLAKMTNVSPKYEETVLIPKFTYLSYDNNPYLPGNTNNVSIFRNENSRSDKRLVIFGDSFFKLSLRFLLLYFRELVFFRTPFFHKDLVDMCKPDYVLSGNAERYLSNVTSDEDAPNFLLSLMNNKTYFPPKIFVDAFNAQLSFGPYPQIYQNWLKSLSEKSAAYLEASVTDSNNTLVVGPSHVIRWRESLKDVAPHETKFSPNNMIATAGAPAWHSKNFKLAKQKAGKDKQILFMVPDFRFGNSIFKESLYVNSQGTWIDELFKDDHLAIDQQCINLSNDIILRERSLAALTAYTKEFDGRIKLLFWDLLGRQVYDRLSGRHFVNGKYSHPTWSLDSIQNKFNEDVIVDLLPLTKIAMHEALRLFIDMSLHPSKIGYLFLEYCVLDQLTAAEAFKKAVLTVEGQIKEIFQPLVQKNTCFVIYGNSIFIYILLRYLGWSGLKKLHEQGIYIIPHEHQLGFPILSAEWLPPTGREYKTLYVLNQEFDSISTNLVGFKPTAVSSKNTILWEKSASVIVKARGIHAKFDDSALSKKLLKAVKLDLQEADVELGDLMHPTYQGLIKMLKTIVSAGESIR